MSSKTWRPAVLEHRESLLLIGDALARRVAKAAGLNIRGTLGILLDAKENRLTDQAGPLLDNLVDAGLWISGDLRRRILRLAVEAGT